MKKSIFVSLLFGLFLGACNKEEPPKNDYLVSFETVRTYTKAQLQQIIVTNDLIPNEMTSLVLYDVRAIKIEYQTVDLEGKPILASGGLLMPISSLPLPVMSFQHGTILDQSEAPSAFLSDFIGVAAIFSSLGYIMPMPDYLGYGSSKQIAHPYQHRKSLATATRDMLRASYELFAAQPNKPHNHNLFLTGYSEGGYATMATLKLLQEEHANEFKVKAATVGAGAYNKTAFAKYLISSTENQPFINYFLWVLDVYNKVYPQLGRNYGHYFNQPFATLISQNGVFTPGIQTNPSLLFTHSFRQGLMNNTDFEMLGVLAQNDCYDWKPNTPLRMYHGTADNFVQYLNSQSAFEAMQARGATQVSLVSIEGGNHNTTLPFYLFGTFGFFAEMSGKRNQLPRVVNPNNLGVIEK